MALILVGGILLVVLKANRSNDIVQFVRDAAGFLQVRSTTPSG